MAPTTHRDGIGLQKFLMADLGSKFVIVLLRDMLILLEDDLHDRLAQMLQSHTK